MKCIAKHKIIQFPFQLSVTDLHPKNVLLLADSPKDQCRFLIHENFFLKLNATGISYNNSF